MNDSPKKNDSSRKQAQADLATDRRDKLLSEVEKMSRVRSEMEDLSRKREAEYLQHSKDLPKSPSEEISRQMDQSLQAQEQVLKEQLENGRRLDEMKQQVVDLKPQEELHSSRDQISSKTNEIKTQQTNSLMQMQQTVEKITASDEAAQQSRRELEHARELQQKSLQAQEEINAQWDKVNEKIQNLESLKQQKKDLENLPVTETSPEEKNQKIQQAQNELNRILEETQKILTEMQQSQQNAADLQSESLQAQKNAEQRFQNDPPPYKPDKLLTQMSASEMAAEAVKLEQEIALWTSRTRAAELAMIQDIPFDKALEITKISVSERKLSYENLDEVKKGEGFAKQEESWSSVMKEMGQISGNVQTWQSMVQTSSTNDIQGAGAYLDWVKGKDESDNGLHNLAAASGYGQAADLSGAMRAATTNGKAQGGNGSEYGENPNDNKPPEGNYQRTAADGLQTLPVLDPKNVKAVPGRKVIAGAAGAEWMYIDSWYIVGPFSNPNRSNRDKRFPPENKVSLDEFYVGRSGQPISWQFIQSSKPMVSPPYETIESVYYAYTELWFEQEQDLWMAVGADDVAKIWVEDQLVYVSQNQLKSWTVGEALRRVHFKQGLNRILYRIENGPGSIAFSLVLSTKPNASAVKSN